MSDYQLPDFRSAKVVTLCRKHKLNVLRMVIPPVERTPNLERPLSLIAEYYASDKVDALQRQILSIDLENALGRKVKIVDLESMPRHVRFETVSNSKVVYA